MGDNGAGKSTLVKVIAGNFPPSHGEILIDGKQVHFGKPLTPALRVSKSSIRTSRLCDNLTAAANVFLGREPRLGFWPIRILDHATMYRRAGELFKELKSETPPARSRQADVRRPATGCGDRSHAPLRGAARHHG